MSVAKIRMLGKHKGPTAAKQQKSERWSNFQGIGALIPHVEYGQATPLCIWKAATCGSGVVLARPTWASSMHQRVPHVQQSVSNVILGLATSSGNAVPEVQRDPVITI